MNAYNQTVAPVNTVVARSDVKDHAKIEHTVDDDLVDAYLAAAIRIAEERLRRQLITATWVLKLDAFPADGAIDLPRPPLQSITSITYVDTEGDTQTLSTDVYDADTDSDPGVLVLQHQQSWPVTRDQRHAVTITYVAGYGDDPEDVPADYRLAIKILAAEYYRERESGGALPGVVKALLGDRNYNA